LIPPCLTACARLLAFKNRAVCVQAKGVLKPKLSTSDPAHSLSFARIASERS
jgi:hypothetical protein